MVKKSVMIWGMRKYRRLWDTYRFPGFRPGTTVQGIFGDPKARVVYLHRRGKKTSCAVCGTIKRGWYDRKRRWVRDLGCGDYRIYLEIEVRRVDCPRY